MPDQRTQSTVISNRKRWAFVASGACVAWGFAFWYLFLVVVCVDVWHIPLGLGGAVYPVLFVGPLIVGALAYELVVARLLSTRHVGRLGSLWWTLGLPMLLTSVLLIIACPLDSTEASLVVHVWNRLTQ